MTKNVAVLHNADATTRLGFWLYLLSDVMIFGSLFATYMVLRHNTAGGPSIHDIVEPSTVLLQTIALLASSFTAAMAQLALRFNKPKEFMQFVLATFGFGLFFLLMEIGEFRTLIDEGHSWQASAFLSAFFALVGTHGVHIAIGLLWLMVLVYRLRTRGVDDNFKRKFGLFALFWHFLDIVWIWLFTIVYMFGAAGI